MTLQTAALTLTSLERMLWVEERPLLSSLNPRLIVNEDFPHYNPKIMSYTFFLGKRTLCVTWFVLSLPSLRLTANPLEVST